MANEQLEEIKDFPEQSTFNTDDMSVIVEEESEENESKND